MKTTYRLLDTTVGGSRTAGVATVALNERLDPNQAVDTREPHRRSPRRRLDGHGRHAEARPRSRTASSRSSPTRKETNFQVYCGVADLVFPEIVKDEKGEYIVMAGRYRWNRWRSRWSSTALWSARPTPTPPSTSRPPGAAQDPPSPPALQGLAGRRSISTTAWSSQIAMEMSAEGLREFAEMTRFLADLKKEQILTDAQAKMWEGYAKQLEQSGVRVDHRSAEQVRHPPQILGDQDLRSRPRTDRTDRGDRRRGRPRSPTRAAPTRARTPTPAPAQPGRRHRHRRRPNNENNAVGTRNRAGQDMDSQKKAAE